MNLLFIMRHERRIQGLMLWRSKHLIIMSRKEKFQEQKLMFREAGCCTMDEPVRPIPLTGLTGACQCFRPATVTTRPGKYRTIA
jgi:hypothetical protein